MPLDRHAKRFLDMLGVGGPAPGSYDTAEERRRTLRDLASGVETEPARVGDIREVTIPGPGGPLTLRLYTPIGAAAAALPGLIYLHGGGWVAGGLDTHDGVCRRLANASGCRVLALDYRLAPEHPFPAAIDDGVAAMRWIAGHADELGVDPSRLGIGGDSAGAGLAAAICLIARDAGGPAIAFQLLICPILDVLEESPSRRELAEGYFLSRATMQRDLDLYCPGVDRGDPHLSPLRAASLAGLPPALIHTAEFDPFRDEGQAYARALTGARVPVQATCHEGLIHYFYAMPAVIPRALTAMAQIGAEVAALVR
jgi:acetyl esterase